MGKISISASICLAMGVVLVAGTLTGCRESQRPADNPYGFQLSRGSGELFWDTPEGATVEELRVLSYIPLTGAIEDMPVLFVFHGADRNAAAYREIWKDLAEIRGCMVFVPEFTEQDFPGSTAYQQGSLMGIDGSIRPEEERLFSLVEPLFDHIVEELGTQKVNYDVWGHSAGAQFVHRFVLFAGELRLRKAVAANAGWYTVPESSSAFPYGLGGSPVGEEGLGIPFSLELSIMLGSEDTAFNETAWSGAYEQGDSRYDRGIYFHSRSLAQALNLGLSCAWQLHEVPGIGHDPQGMAEAAAPLLYP